MFQRLLKQEKAVTLALCSYKHISRSEKAKSVDLKPDHYLTMQKVADILVPFEEATTILYGDSYITFSVVHPLVEHLVRVVNNESASS